MNTACFGRIQSHPRSSLLWSTGNSRAQRFSPRWGDGRSRAQWFKPRWCEGRSRAQWERKVFCVTLLHGKLKEIGVHNMEALRESYAHTENIHDKTVSTREIAGICSLENGSGSHKRSTRHRCAVANLRLLQHVWKTSLFMSTPVTSSSQSVCNPTDSSAEI